LRILTIFVLALSIHILNAQEGQPAKPQPFIEKIRPTLVKFLGSETTDKIIGAAPVVAPIEEIPMPPLPKLVEDATSTAIYDKKPDRVSIAPEIEQKYYLGYIRELYEVTRQQKPNDDEISKMMNVLTQGGTREGIYRSLVLDSTYGGMENWDKPVKSVTADFAVYFYEKYLGKKIAKKSFEGMSVYTLKRLVTEKALDIADAYGDDRENLEKWYAIISSDLAKRFPSVGSNIIRKNPSALAHKAWASKVPVQHIKSELIIKLHISFNSLF
jgi:hypothetical protein